MNTPDHEQARYDRELAARLRYPGLIEEAVQVELETAGVDLTEEVTKGELLYALESDKRELRRSGTAWFARNYGEEMTVSELRDFVKIDVDHIYWGSNDVALNHVHTPYQWHRIAGGART